MSYLWTVCAVMLQASPRIQTDEGLVKDISDKLEQGNVTESIFDAVQAKVLLISLHFDLSHSFDRCSCTCLSRSA